MTGSRSVAFETINAEATAPAVIVCDRAVNHIPPAGDGRRSGKVLANVRIGIRNHLIVTAAQKTRNVEALLSMQPSRWHNR